MAQRAREVMGALRISFGKLRWWRDCRRWTAEARRRAEAIAQRRSLERAWRQLVAVASRQWQRHAWKGLGLVRASCWSKLVESARWHRRHSTLKRCVDRWFRALIMLRLSEAAQHAQLCQSLSVGMEGCVAECSESLAAAATGLRGRVEEWDAAQQDKRAALIEECCSLLADANTSTLHIVADKPATAMRNITNADAGASEPKLSSTKLNRSKLNRSKPNSATAIPGQLELFASTSSLVGPASSVVRATPAVNRRERGPPSGVADSHPHDPFPNNSNPI
eukprot:3633141-Rhodomonas_salina.1